MAKKEPEVPSALASMEVPIEWYVPDNIESHYANNILVQNSLSNEFIIYFFEAVPPLIIGSPDEIREKLQEVKSVRAKCVARIVVNADVMPRIVQAMQTNYAIYLARTSQTQDDR